MNSIDINIEEIRVNVIDFYELDRLEAGDWKFVGFCYVFYYYLIL